MPPFLRRGNRFLKESWASLRSRQGFWKIWLGALKESHLILTFVHVIVRRGVGWGKTEVTDGSVTRMHLSGMCAYVCVCMHVCVHYISSRINSLPLCFPFTNTEHFDISGHQTCWGGGCSPHQAILCNICCVSQNLNQFWHYGPGDSTRSHRAQSHRPAPSPLQTPTPSPGCLLYFWPTGYRITVSHNPSLGSSTLPEWLIELGNQLTSYITGSL